MKNFFLILIVAIFFSGCDDNSTFEQPPAKDILTSTTWYMANELEDKYYIRRFTQDKLIQKRYSDGKYEDIIEENSYDIEYISDDKLKIYIDSKEYICTYCNCLKDEWFFLDCKPKLDDLDSKYFCGWSSKYEALKNK